MPTTTVATAGNGSKQRFIEPGQFGYGIMPHSEVCMHLKVADCAMFFQLLESGRMVQLYEHFRIFSAPITTGEAGIYTDMAINPSCRHYYYAEKLPLDNMVQALVDLNGFCREVEAHFVHGCISTELGRRAVKLQAQLCLK